VPLRNRQDTLFAKAFSAAPVSLTITSLTTGRLLEVNETFVRITGYSRDEAVGKTTIELGLWADRADREAELAMVAAQGTLRNREYRFRSRDGREIVGLLSAERLDIDGEPCALTVIEDITERVAAQRQASASAAELHALQQRLLDLTNATASILASPQPAAVTSATIAVARTVFPADAYALWRFDAERGWRVVESLGISDAFTERFIAMNGGRRVRGELEFADPIVFEDVAVAPMLAELRDAYAAEGVVSMIVFPLMIRGRRTGTIVFYLRQRRSFGSADLQAGSALANIAAAALTAAELYAEQQAAREAADSARQHAAFLAEVGAVLSSSLDYQSTLRSVARLAVPTIADWCAVDIVNDRGVVERLAVAHVDPEKVAYAHQLQQRYPPDPNTPGGVDEVIRTGRPAMMSRIPPESIERAARDDEHLRILRAIGLTSYMCVPLVGRGRAIGAITFVSAESGREYSEDDLHLVRELAARASLAVENARAYADAANANRLKDDFLATLSHELRTPLNAVLGYARMLRSGIIAPERIQPALATLERNASSLKQIIEDVLDVSRIISGRLRMHVEPVDLASVVREAAATMVPAADAKGVRLEIAIAPAMPPFSGDPSRLQQLIWNLLSNAIKFTPRDGAVKLSLDRVDSHVEMVVADTGVGILPEFLPYVFDRFRQADSTFAREHGGLGLGLAIAKHLAELHGGTIAAASEGPGKGARFTVRLPLRAVQTHAVPDAAHGERVAERGLVSFEGAPRLDGVRVLTVDDQDDSLGLLSDVLDAAGAHVTSARSAAAALDAIKRECPDVVIADIGMPGLDGLGLVRAIRQLDEPARSVPAAALTAYARAQDRILSLASGFQMHLVKPIDPLELIVAVAALHSRQPQSGSRPPGQPPQPDARVRIDD
jgi:PAS domain S-box-containing protein